MDEKIIEKSSDDKAYIMRMSKTMHYQLKTLSNILDKNMQSIVLEAIEEKIEHYKKTNENVKTILNIETNK
jgi:predicted DNA-binding protein